MKNNVEIKDLSAVQTAVSFNKHKHKVEANVPLSFSWKLEILVNVKKVLTNDWVATYNSETISFTKYLI